MPLPAVYCVCVSVPVRTRAVAATSMPSETTALLVCYCRHMPPASGSALCMLGDWCGLVRDLGRAGGACDRVLYVTSRGEVETTVAQLAAVESRTQHQLAPAGRLSCVSPNHLHGRTHKSHQYVLAVPDERASVSMSNPRRPQHTVVCGEQTERRNEEEKGSVIHRFV